MAATVEIFFEGIDNFSTTIGKFNAGMQQMRDAANSVNMWHAPLVRTWKDSYKELGQNMQILGNNIVQVGSFADNYFGRPVRTALGNATNASKEFKTELLLTSKSANLTAEQTATLADETLRLTRSIPLTSSEFNKLSAVAGSMNIPLSDMKGYMTETAIAADNLGLPLEATAIQFGTLTKASGMGRVELRDYAAALNRLAAETPATEAGLVEFMRTFIQVGKSAKMNAREMVALGSTMLQFGAVPSTASRALGMFIPKLQTATTQTGSFKRGLEVAGISATELEKRMSQGATPAILWLTEAFDKLNPTERARAMSLMMGEHYKTLQAVFALNNYSTALGIVNDTTKNAELYQNEYNMRLKDASSIQKIYNNSLQELQIRLGDAILPLMVGLLKAITPLIHAVSDFVAQHPRLTQMVVVFVGLGAALTSLIVPLGFFINSLGIIISTIPVVVTFMTARLIPALVAVAARFRLAGLASIAMNTALMASVGGVGRLALGFLGMINPVTRVILLVTTLLGLLAKLAGKGKTKHGDFTPKLDTSFADVGSADVGNSGGGINFKMPKFNFGSKVDPATSPLPQVDAGGTDNSVDYHPTYNVEAQDPEAFGDMLKTHERTLLDTIDNAQTRKGFRQS